MIMKKHFPKILCLLLLLPACSKINMRTTPRPKVHLLIKNNGFEEDGAWAISAPPNYNYYGEIDARDPFCQSGKRCGLISLQRLPGKNGELILHAFTQQFDSVPRGKSIVFGGWVAASPGTTVRLTIEYETTQPHGGQTLFSENLIWSADENRFHFLSSRLQFPSDVTHAYFIAAIASPGEARFDNLFAFVDPRPQPEQKEFTRK